MAGWIKWATIGAGAAWAVLMLSEKGVLVSQDIAAGGEEYFVEGWGNLGESDSPSLVCTYFVGTRFRKEVFWHAPSGIFGKADCPVLIDR